MCLSSSRVFLRISALHLRSCNRLVRGRKGEGTRGGEEHLDGWIGLPDIRLEGFHNVSSAWIGRI